MSTQIEAAARRRSPIAETVFPPDDPSTVQPLLAFLEAHEHDACLVAPDGATTDVPGPVLDVLRDVAVAMSRGRAITVAPVSLRLTTTQAAEILGVSRPTLVKLLDAGEIPFDRPRRHRLLRLDDVLAYRERQHQSATAQLDEITRQAVADGLYEEDAGTYRDALREARSGGG